MKDLTEGSIPRHLMVISGACLVNMLTGTLFSLASIYWVGRMGPEAQAAVTLATIPVLVFVSLLPVLSVGAAILVSHSVGAGDSQRANRVFNEAFGAAWLGTALLAVLGWATRDAIGAWMAPDAATASLIAAYYAWLLPGVVIQIPMLVMAGALGATGNIKVATITQSGTALLNAGLMPILMFGWGGFPGLGIAGAGVATLMACAVGLMGLAVYASCKDAYLVLVPGVWFGMPRELAAMVRIGLPTGLQGGLMAGYMVAIAVLMRPFGAEAIAGFGVGQRVLQAGMMPLLALGSAVSIVVGQNFGAGLKGRITETFRCGMLLVMVVAPSAVLVFQFSSGSLAGLFSSDPAVIEAGASFLRICAYSLVPAGIAQMVFAVASGMGNTRVALYCSMAYCALVVLPVWAMSPASGFKPEWMWTTLVGATIGQAAVALLFLRRAMGWREHRFSATGAPGLRGV